MIELQQTEEKQLPREIQKIRSFVKQVILKDVELRNKHERNTEVDANAN